MKQPSRTRRFAPLVVALSMVIGHQVSYAAGNADRGADVFATECSDCHSIKEGKHKRGPSLFALLGRRAASSEGFTYSDGLRTSGLVWNADTLDRYITNPKALVPTGKMKYDGLAATAARDDLIAWLSRPTR